EEADGGTNGGGGAGGGGNRGHVRKISDMVAAIREEDDDEDEEEHRNGPSANAHGDGDVERLRDEGDALAEKFNTPVTIVSPPSPRPEAAEGKGGGLLTPPPGD
ncbi:hypothetical protein LTS18_003842, partial [Coniosporium uncinatum]